LKDRHELSLQNNWVNENNEVYLVFTRENMADMLGCSQPTLRKSLKQLIDSGLMEEERMGLNRANRIYLTAVSLENRGVKDSFSPEGKILSLQSENNLQSRRKDSFGQECKDFSPNDTNTNYTDFSDTNHINPSEDKNDGYDVIDLQKGYEKLIKENIAYDYLFQNKIGWREDVESIVGIMVDVCSMPEDSLINVNGTPMSVGVVKSQFLKIDSSHIEYIMGSLNDNPSDVRNIRAYLITTIYNAPNTISQYYRSKVNHDLYGGR
jgi:DNA-binding Lrp family transcriptional regulator